MIWIKCSDKQPEWPVQNTFLAYNSFYGIFIQHGHYRRSGCNKMFTFQGCEITHWMPMPEPPVLESVEAKETT